MVLNFNSEEIAELRKLKGTRENISEDRIGSISSIKRKKIECNTP